MTVMDFSEAVRFLDSWLEDRQRSCWLEAFLLRTAPGSSGNGSPFHKIRT